MHTAPFAAAHCASMNILPLSLLPVVIASERVQEHAAKTVSIALLVPHVQLALFLPVFFRHAFAFMQLCAACLVMAALSARASFSLSFVMGV